MDYRCSEGIIRGKGIKRLSGRQPLFTGSGVTPLGQEQEIETTPLGDSDSIDTGDGVFTRDDLHTHFKPMTKFNQTVLATVSSIALFGGALTLIAQPAKADYVNSTQVGNQTFGYGSNGSSFNTNQIGSQTFYNGTTSGGSHFSGSCNQIGNQTFCN